MVGKIDAEENSLVSQRDFNQQLSSQIRIIGETLDRPPHKLQSLKSYPETLEATPNAEAVKWGFQFYPLAIYIL
jgi:hypothetical protein